MEFFAQRFAGEIGPRGDQRSRGALSKRAGHQCSQHPADRFYAADVPIRPQAHGHRISIAALNFVALRLLTNRYARQSLRQRGARQAGGLLDERAADYRDAEVYRVGVGFLFPLSGYQAKVVNAEQELGIWSELFGDTARVDRPERVAIIGLGFASWMACSPWEC